MARTSRHQVEPTAPVADPDNVPSPKPDYWISNFTYRQLVEESAKETLNIPTEIWQTFLVGLENDKGPGAIAAYRADSSRAWSERYDAKQACEDPKSTKEPPSHVEQLFRLEGLLSGIETPVRTDVELPRWGYVVFRTAGYGEDGEARWKQARAVWEELISSQFRPDVDRGALGAKQAAQKFRCYWIEGPEWEGASAEQMAKQYRTIEKSLDGQLDHYLFLSINEASLESLLTAPLKHQRNFSWMPKPFVLAVARHAGTMVEIEVDDKGKNFQPESINVAIESLVDGLFPVIARQVMDFCELVAGAKEDDIWLSPFTRRKMAK